MAVHQCYLTAQSGSRNSDRKAEVFKASFNRSAIPHDRLTVATADSTCPGTTTRFLAILRMRAGVTITGCGEKKRYEEATIILKSASRSFHSNYRFPPH